MVNSVSYPNSTRNYCLFDENKVAKYIQEGEKSLPEINQTLLNPSNEEEVLEGLYILNRLLDKGVDSNKVSELYPALSKYNETDSPNIQTFLAGIYRKTKVPDAFGPLVKMLVKDSINPPQETNFDPTEEIGGAILDYLA